MSIPSLTIQCAEKIVHNESLFKNSQKLPLEALNIIMDFKLIEKWKWFVTPVKYKDLKLLINLTPKNYKDFSVLCPTYLVKEEEFSPYSDQKNHNIHTVSKIVEFVRSKGSIKSVSLETDCFTESHQRFISLYYHIPIADRNSSSSVEIAEIKLPSKQGQTIEICIEPLSKINQEVKSLWDQDTYDKLSDFVIYYVNQLANDNSGKSHFSFSPVVTDNRLYLAHKAKDEDTAKKYLFEYYNGPDYWLLNET